MAKIYLCHLDKYDKDIGLRFEKKLLKLFGVKFKKYLLKGLCMENDALHLYIYI